MALEGLWPKEELGAIARSSLRKRLYRIPRYLSRHAEGVIST